MSKAPQRVWFIKDVVFFSSSEVLVERLLTIGHEMIIKTRNIARATHGFFI